MFDHEIQMMLEREAGMPEGVPEVQVGFGMMPEENGPASAKAGHPVFIDREYVMIAVPGDDKSTYLQPATDTHRKRFPRAYQAFRTRETKPMQSGMPIEQWPQVTRSMAMTLRGLNIFTVEALAAVHDGHIEGIGSNGRELRSKAQAFLKTAKDNAASQEIAKENEQLRTMIADLQKQMADLAGQMQNDKPKRGPGRPPKEQAAA